MFYNFDKIETIEPMFKALENLRGVSQRKDYHPEKDAFVHSLQVFYIGVRESSDVDLLLAGLFHDVGKAVDTLGHDDYSCRILKGHISEKTEWLIAQHIRIKYLLSGEMKKQSKRRYLLEHKWFNDLILLSKWDTLGRDPNWFPVYDRVEIITRLKKFI